MVNPYLEFGKTSSVYEHTIEDIRKRYLDEYKRTLMIDLDRIVITNMILATPSSNGYFTIISELDEETYDIDLRSLVEQNKAFFDVFLKRGDYVLITSDDRLGDGDDINVFWDGEKLISGAEDLNLLWKFQ